ncbi:MAG: TraB/GumN family protein [Fibrobacterales bacterium]
MDHSENIEKSPVVDLAGHADIYRVTKGSKEYILVGTAHVSQESADLAQQVIIEEHPDTVCIELDEKRYESITQEKNWQSLDLREIIKKKQLAQFVVSLIMSSYQKKLGSKLGVQPGSEFLASIKTAKDTGIAVALCDRDIKTTMKRAWTKTPLYKKGMLLASIFGSLFEKAEISEDKLRELRQSDAMSEMMKEMGDALPTVKETLIDERDEYLAEKIRQADGNKKVAILGAGHVPGIIKILENDTPVDLDDLDTIPRSIPWGIIIGSLIAALIIGSLVYIGMTKGAEVAGENLLFWVLINGIPAAIGSLIAFAHPVTTIVAFLAAPVTSINPAMGVGYVTAFVQVFLKPPRVFEFEQLSEDVGHYKQWWKNRILRIVLVMIFTTLGSAIGTYVGGYELIKNLF